MRNTVHRFVRTVVPTTLLGVPALVLVLAAPGCSDNNGTQDINVSLFIQGVQAPDPSNQCAVSNDPTALPLWGSSVMDTTLATEYVATLLVGLVARDDSATLSPENSRVQLYQADVELLDASSVPLSSVSVPISGFVDASQSATPAYGLVTMTLIDPATASLGGQQALVTAHVRLYGHTLGGLDVETDYWDYPIEMCRGCMACVCPASASAEYHKTCNPGVNEAVDCRLEACWGTESHCGCPVTG